MGQGQFERSNDFSDTLYTHIDTFILDGNLYWNGGKDIPTSIFDKLNYEDDANSLIMNPQLTTPSNITTPTWDSQSATFSDGSLDIEQVFNNLLSKYGIPQHPVKSITRLKPADDDIYNNKRPLEANIGAFQ